MFFNSDNNPIAESVYVFMSVIFPEIKETDVEVIHTDLTEDNVFGWTLINNDQNEIEIHNDLSTEDYITTLIHELIHVDQNVRGLRDDEKRENEAYKLEKRLAKDFMKCRNALTMEKVKRLYPEYDFTNATLEICY